ncbi:hypothetical protein K8R03_02560 [Candidatus Kaiserbacteria bacterium]|nr:hypothetical protein [Candidatus Kaiserbacteria bacterium]
MNAPAHGSGGHSGGDGAGWGKALFFVIVGAFAIYGILVASGNIKINPQTADSPPAHESVVDKARKIYGD